jgi:hypothetical protein
MTDLVTWLRQALDAEEQLAMEANDGEVEWIGDDAAEHGCDASGRFINRWVPSRVEAEVAAKRAILDAYTEAAEFYDAPANRHQPAGEVHGLYAAVQWLAVPYASNPGFDESWRPV